MGVLIDINWTKLLRISWRDIHPLGKHNTYISSSNGFSIKQSGQTNDMREIEPNGRLIAVGVIRQLHYYHRFISVDEVHNIQGLNETAEIWSYDDPVRISSVTITRVGVGLE